MINFSFIHDSIEFYQNKGFKRIEVPWTVTQAISNITKPPGAEDFSLSDKHQGKVLVASAEQSFLYLYCKGFLPKGKFQAITPCFRHEPFDSLHSKYFIKNELINTEQVDSLRLREMVGAAEDFFKSLFPGEEKEIKIQGDGITGDSWDIMYRGIELGSYGIRSCDFVEWIYGTAIAEPRVTMAKTKYRLELDEKERFDSY